MPAHKIYMLLNLGNIKKAEITLIIYLYIAFLKEMRNKTQRMILGLSKLAVWYLYLLF